ncbi:MAG: hypothetical protein WDW38_007626 [Sanguina aurantia]
MPVPSNRLVGQATQHTTGARAVPVTATSVVSVLVSGMQDVVLPPLNGDFYGMYVRGAESYLASLRPAGSAPERKHLASLAGGMCGWMSKEVPPCAHGWVWQGGRNVAAPVMGCIPVIISDNVYQPFQLFLDWNAFGVVIPQARIDDTEAILRAITPEELEKKRELLRCASRHLTYTTISGTYFMGDDGRLDAMSTLWHILRARVARPGLSDEALLEPDVAQPHQHHHHHCTQLMDHISD